MNQHLRIITAVLCLLPLIARADQKPADGLRLQAIKLTKQLAKFRMIISLGENHESYEASVKFAADLEAKLKNLPPVSEATQEYYRLQAQLDYHASKRALIELSAKHIKPENYPDYIKAAILKHQLVIDQTSPYIAIAHSKMMAEAADRAAQLKAQLQAITANKKLIQQLINSLTNKALQPDEQEQLVAAYDYLGILSTQEKELTANNLPALTRSEPARGQEQILAPAANLPAPVGLTSDLTFTPDIGIVKPNPIKPANAMRSFPTMLGALEESFPEAPQSSPADFDGESTYANALARAHDATGKPITATSFDAAHVDMEGGMDDMARAIALSKKEAAEAAALQGKNNKPAAATASATPATGTERDTKSSAATGTKGARSVLAERTDIDDARNSALQQALLESQQPTTQKPNEPELEKKTRASATKNGAHAPVFVKPPLVAQETLIVNDPETRAAMEASLLEQAMAESQKSLVTDAQRQAEQAAAPAPQPAAPAAERPAVLDARTLSNMSYWLEDQDNNPNGNGSNGEKPK